MLVLINPFTVFDGEEDAFLALWDQTNAIMSTAPGYISARLVRAADHQAPGHQAPFTHVNVAEWQSLETYKAALANPAVRKLAGEYIKVCTFDPAVYEVVREGGEPTS